MSGWWATDSRRSISGKLIDVILEKRGQKGFDDLSQNEAVQMGKALEQTIGRIFEEQTGIGVRHFTDDKTHPTEPWLKAHTDFLTSDGGLLEVKNFNTFAINDYSEMDEPIRMPEADYIQCLHEATVFDVPHVYFAVLFGGQRFRFWKLEFTADQKAEFVQRAASWWGLSQAGDLPPPETNDQAKKVYAVDRGGYVVATKQVEQLIAALKNVKGQISPLETAQEEAEVILKKFMADKSEIVDVSGRSLVTWKAAKSTMVFDLDAFKTAFPDLYQQFKREKPGSRRFLVK